MSADNTDRPVPPPLPDAEGRRAAELISGARLGDADCINELIRLIYPELKRRARWLMAGERTGHTFGPSGSELVQRVIESTLATGGEIFSAADTEEDLIRMLTRRMRFILVDYARAATAQRRPSPRKRHDFEDASRTQADATVNIAEVLGTHEALTKLAELDPEAARAVELRFFAGLTNDEAAAAMGLSVASFRRTLKRGTIFFKAALEPPPPPEK